MCAWGRWQDRSGIPGIECDRTFPRWQQLSQSKIASDSHVNCVCNRLLQERHRTGLSREQMSLWLAGYPKTPRLRRPIWGRSGHSGVSGARPLCGHWNSAARCPLCAISRHSTPLFVAMRLMLSCRAVNRIAAQSYKPTFLPEKDKIRVVTDLRLYSTSGAIWACDAGTILLERP